MMSSRRMNACCLSGRLVAGHDDDPAALMEQGQRSFLHADVAGQLGGPRPVRFERDMAQRSKIRVRNVADGQDGEPLVVQQQLITGLHAPVLDVGGVQRAHVVQLGWGALTEDDEHPLLDEVGDQRADAGDGRRVPDGFRHQTASMSSVPTPETNRSSVMKLASGPDGLVAWMSTVSTFFIGYTPTRAVPPQSMTATAILSNGADQENPSNACPPVSAAIRAATGWIPPPVTE